MRVLIAPKHIDHRISEFMFNVSFVLIKYAKYGMSSKELEAQLRVNQCSAPYQAMSKTSREQGIKSLGRFTVVHVMTNSRPHKQAP